MNDAREAARIKIAKALEHLEKVDTAPLSALETKRLQEVVRELQGMESNIWRMR